MKPKRQFSAVEVDRGRHCLHSWEIGEYNTYINVLKVLAVLDAGERERKKKLM